MAISSLTFFLSFNNCFSFSWCLLIFGLPGFAYCFFCLFSSCFFCILRIVWFKWASSTCWLCFETNSWWAPPAFLEYCLHLRRPNNVFSLSDVCSFVKTFLLSESDLSTSAFPWLMKRHVFIKFWMRLNSPFPAAFLMSKICSHYSSIRTKSPFSKTLA